MLRLKLQYFGQLNRRANSLEKTLMLEKIEGRRRRGWQRMKWLDDITDSMDMRLSKLQEMVREREPWCAAVQGGVKSQSQPSNWTIYTLKSLMSQTTYYSKIISTRKSVLRIIEQWWPSAKCDDLQTFHNYYFHSQNTVDCLMLPSLMKLMHFWYHSNSLHHKALTKLESESKVKNIFNM